MYTVLVVDNVGDQLHLKLPTSLLSPLSAPTATWLNLLFPSIKILCWLFGHHAFINQLTANSPHEKVFGMCLEVAASRPHNIGKPKPVSVLPRSSEMSYSWVIPLYTQ